MGRVAWIALVALNVLFFQPAVSGKQQYEPSVGQEGKDVIWVPTPEEVVNAMLDLAKVTPRDFVMDLGSGDGRIVIAAAKRGAHATGIEFNPDMVALSRRNAEQAGVADKATFLNGDLFAADFSKATVITMYLLPSLNLKLRPTILGLKPGTRIVSHAFDMGDWEADQIVEKDGRTAYLWIVPARVEGLWKWQNSSDSAELQLTQAYQMVKGQLKINGKSVPLEKAKLHGDHLSFSAGGQEYSGRVNGGLIEGTIRTGGREQKWTAARR